MNPKTAGALMIIASAAGFATLAIFIKFAYAAGVDTLNMITLRFIIASVLLWLIIKLRGLSPVVGKKLALQLFFLGAFGYGSMSLLFAASLQYVTASLAAMLLYTYPAIVCLLAFSIGDERFTWPKVAALAICFFGLFLILGVSFNGIDPIGIILGLASAVVYSCYIVISNRILKETDSLVVTTYVCTFSAVTLLAAVTVNGSLSLAFPLQGWIAIVGMALFCSIVGILGFFAGMARIGASNAAILSTIEPVITVLLSVALLSDKITLVQGLGGVLILIGVVILQLWSTKSSDPLLENS